MRAMDGLTKSDLDLLCVYVLSERKGKHLALGNH